MATKKVSRNATERKPSSAPTSMEATVRETIHPFIHAWREVKLPRIAQDRMAELQSTLYGISALDKLLRIDEERKANAASGGPQYEPDNFVVGGLRCCMTQLLNAAHRHVEWVLDILGDQTAGRGA